MFHAITYGQMNATYAATVGGEWSGSMKKGHFLAQTGVGAFHRVSFNHWERIKVDSFNVTIVRDTSIILMTKNAGNVFHENLKTLLKGIMTGDKVLIFDIYATDLSKKKVFLAPLEYLIE
jgi:hypothetical protein